MLKTTKNVNVLPVLGVLCTRAFQMCTDDCRTTLTASWRARYSAARIRSRRSTPSTSTKAFLEDSARAVSSASSSSSISALPLIPETLNSSSPTSVIEDCYSDMGQQEDRKGVAIETHPDTPARIEHSTLQLWQEQIDGLA